MASPRRKFSKIYDNHLEQIFRFIFLKVGSKEPAEDLTSAVFAKTWDKFKKGQKIDNVSAYLYQVARAEIANYYRWKAKFKKTPLSSAEAELTSQAKDPEKARERAEALQEMQVKLATLKEEEQNIVIWRYIDNLSIKEIARVTERPAGTVRVMLHRALKELREKLADN